MSTSEAASKENGSESTSSSGLSSYFGWLEYLNPFTSKGSAVDLHEDSSNSAPASSSSPGTHVDTATRERFVLESGERVVIAPSDDYVPRDTQSSRNGASSAASSSSATTTVTTGSTKENLPIVAPSKVRGSELTTTTPTYTYADFARRMKLCGSGPTQQLKRFVADLAARPKLGLEVCPLIHAFTTQMYNRIIQLPAWTEADPAELDNAFESIERFCISKLYHRIFPSNNKEMVELDQRVTKAMYTLSWIRPEHLDIPAAYWDYVLLDHAANELRKMDDYRSPRDKIVCLLNACKVICSLLKRAYNKYQRRKQREQRARELEEQLAREHKQTGEADQVLSKEVAATREANGLTGSSPRLLSPRKQTQGEGKTDDQDDEDQHEDGEETFRALVAAAAAANQADAERAAASAASSGQDGDPEASKSDTKTNAPIQKPAAVDNAETQSTALPANATAANMVGRKRPEKKKYEDVPLSMGADTFVPLFLYVILRAVPNRIYLNLEFMRCARHPSKLRGEAEYYVTQLQSAAAFFLRCDHTCFSVPKDVYEANVKKLGEEYEQIKQWEAQMASNLANADGSLTPLAGDPEEEDK